MRGSQIPLYCSNLALSVSPFLCSSFSLISETPVPYHNTPPRLGVVLFLLQKLLGEYVEGLSVEAVRISRSDDGIRRNARSLGGGEGAHTIRASGCHLLADAGVARPYF
ncbi:hypothetical protein KSP39_PZI012531 [Platanthera zijinensis]|uniref:Uncharacterized protein n=1 Tax=Platanthera zijinensis TaxID=2320716 RepID=A0AAP0G4S1_9ASPA